MKNRIVHIDIAKGIAIALVAMYHSFISNYYPEALRVSGLFQVPLFFLLSGLFASYSSGVAGFLLKRFDQILKPYFFTLFSILMLTVLLGSKDWFSEFWGIFYGSISTLRWQAMWFLPHLFLVFVFFFCVYRYLKFDLLPTPAKIIMLAVCYVFGVFNLHYFLTAEWSVGGKSYKEVGLPFSADLLLISGFYFIIGYEFKSFFLKRKLRPLILVLSTLIFASVVIFSNAFIDMASRRVEQPILSMIAGCAGILMVLEFAKLIAQYVNWLKQVFSILGESTLIILIFHSTINFNLFKILSPLMPSDNAGFVLVVFCYLMGLCLPLVIRAVIIRITPLAWFYFPLNYGGKKV